MPLVASEPGQAPAVGFHRVVMQVAPGPRGGGHPPTWKRRPATGRTPSGAGDDTRGHHRALDRGSRFAHGGDAARQSDLGDAFAMTSNKPSTSYRSPAEAAFARGPVGEGFMRDNVVPLLREPA